MGEKEKLRDSCIRKRVRNWRCEGGCCSCSLGNSDSRCPSIEPVTTTRASGPSSFEKTDHCVNCCDSQSCTPAQEEEQDPQSGAPQLTVLSCCFLLLTGLAAQLSSWLNWQFNHEIGIYFLQNRWVGQTFNHPTFQKMPLWMQYVQVPL